MKKFIDKYNEFLVNSKNAAPNKCPFGDSLVVDVNGDVKRCFFSAPLSNIDNIKLSQVMYPEDINNCFSDRCFQYLF
jgi:hypothetical protein